MNKKITTFTILILIFLSTTGYSQIKKTARPDLNDSYNYIAINNCKMWISNNGSGSYYPKSYSGGFLWPGGESATKSLIFEDGLIWGGIVDDTLVIVNGNTHRGHLRPGKILPDGSPDDSSLSKYRVFKIRKDWEELPEGTARDNYEADYYEWPMQDGAPYQDLDKDGKYTPGNDKPDFIGDEVLWYVSNDLDSNYALTTLRPLGIEVQTTVFAFNRQDSFADIIFKKYIIINKGRHNIKDMYIGYWSDPDLGDANDDFCGCDTALNIGYAYNSKPNDLIYGPQPPAVGYEFINTSPKISNNKILTSFNVFISSSGSYRDPLSVTEYYNALQGRLLNGNHYVNPQTGRTTKYCVPGDPVTQTGWYEGSGWPNGPRASDRRMMLSTGPFNFLPDDTIKIVLAIIVGNGSDYLSNIYNMKQKASDAKIIYSKNFETVKPPASPVMHYYPMNRAVRLWWEKDAEEIEYPDPFYNPADNSFQPTYLFEGYRLWQYEDKNGKNPHLITIFDIQNNVITIYDWIYINGILMDAPVIVGPNKGLQRETIVSSDYFANYAPLNNYSPYYFGVTAYYYNPILSPTYLESDHNPVEVIPGQVRIDETFPLRDNDAIIAKQVSGNSDAVIKFNVIDPTALTGDEYQVKFSVINDNLFYSLYDKTKGTTLLETKNDFTKDLTNKPVVDGFILSVENTGKDSIAAENTNYRVKSILEVKGKDGIDLEQPIDVINNLNSTNKWQIKIKGNFNRLNWQEKPADEGLGYDDYELRFTGSSQYYVSGRAYSFNPILRDDPLAKNTLPFEAWCIGRNIDSTQYYYRLTLKVWDFDRHDSTRTIPDSIWTQLDNNDWEEIYAYKSAFDPVNLPPTSGNSKFTDHKFGGLCFSGDVPDPGTLIRIITYKPLKDGDVFEAKLEAGNLNDKEAAKKNIDKISVFPNPFFGTNNITNLQQDFIRFISVPKEVTIRIYNLAGVFIRKLTKNDLSSYIDWDLQNENGERVGSGIYIAYLEMPGIGKKYIKIAIVQDKKYLQRY